jgi:hypothetical protein
MAIRLIPDPSSSQPRYINPLSPGSRREFKAGVHRKSLSLSAWHHANCLLWQPQTPSHLLGGQCTHLEARKGTVAWDMDEEPSFHLRLSLTLKGKSPPRKPSASAAVGHPSQHEDKFLPEPSLGVLRWVERPT